LRASSVTNSGVGILARLGPQLQHEAALPRRLRFHQSWYRSEVLKIDAWGATRAGRPLGSILPGDAAARGENFTTSDAQASYLRRRLTGWGADPVRSTSYMTSSQALMFNIFGLLVTNFGWTRDVLNLTLGRSNIRSLLRFELEFAPLKRSHYLNDMTRVDVMFIVEADQGVETIALELKFADRFNSRKVTVSGKAGYERLADETGIWNNSLITLNDQKANQLLRCHALAASVLAVEYGVATGSTLLVLHHRNDDESRALVAGYRRQLTNENSCLEVTLDHFLAVAAATAPSSQRRIEVQKVANRYLLDGDSEEAWLDYIASR
jgi:hypothetical protein